MSSDLPRRIRNKMMHILSPYVRRIGRFLPEKFPQGTKFFSATDAHIHCGYYDVSPLDKRSARLLVLQAAQGNVSPHTTGHIAAIGYYQVSESSLQFIKIADTRAWNWQQAARQQWVPHHPDYIHYNDFDGHEYCSHVRNVQNGELIQTYNWPIYALHPDKALALSLNFSRLHHYRAGYGYYNRADNTVTSLAPGDDGLFLCRTDTGAKELLVSLRQLADFEPSQGMATAGHYINHLQWAPDGQGIIFFHQWQAEGKKKKQGRLMLRRPDGALRVITPQIRPSHTAWRDDGALLVTGYSTASAAMYHLLADDYGDAADVCPAADVDGHPSFIDAQTVLTDTYPNIFGFQNLFTCGLHKMRQQHIIASCYLPADFHGEMRCDLHPRLSLQKDFVVIDIVKNGRRAVAVMPAPSRKS